MSAVTDTSFVPIRIADAYGVDPASVATLTGGHLNLTFIARRADGSRCVIQRINRIFPAEVNLDIDAVSRHLTARGLVSPDLLRTRSGEPWLADDDGIWRALSFIDGESTETLRGATQARAAGLLLGRFHTALADFEYSFASVRSNPHETAKHIAALEQALDAHRDHRHIDTIAPLAHAILTAANSLEPLPTAPLRVVHGDPKLSNLIFDRESGTGLCLVDLDTLGRRGIGPELGDAFRSWCNPAGEDAPGASFSLAYFEAAMAGYAAGSGDLLTPAERQAIPGAVHVIGIELAARFCADALAERYFDWDRRRFEDASAHNLARARAQLTVGLAAAAARDAMHTIVQRAFADVLP